MRTFLLVVMVLSSLLCASTQAPAQEKDTAAQATFEGNPTLNRALRRAFWKNRTPLLQRIRIVRAMNDPQVRQEIEFELTQMALQAGAIPPEGNKVNSEGIYVGNWITDLLDWVINNWDSILEMIITIINLFNDQQAAIPVAEVPLLGLAA